MSESDNRRSSGLQSGGLFPNPSGITSSTPSATNNPASAPTATASSAPTTGGDGHSTGTGSGPGTTQPGGTESVASSGSGGGGAPPPPPGPPARPPALPPGLQGDGFNNFFNQLAQLMGQFQQAALAAPTALVQQTAERARPAQPERFAGHADVSKLESWMVSMNDYLNVTNVVDPARVRFAATYLTGEASSWWAQRKLADPTLDTCAFERFRDMMYSYYRPRHPAEIAIMTVSRLRMTAGPPLNTVAAYTIRFNELLIHVTYVQLPEIVRVIYYREGLSDQIRQLVATQSTHSLPEIQDLAQRIDLHANPSRTRLLTAPPGFSASSSSSAQPALTWNSSSNRQSNQSSNRTPQSSSQRGRMSTSNTQQSVSPPSSQPYLTKVRINAINRGFTTQEIDEMEASGHCLRCTGFHRTKGCNQAYISADEARRAVATSEPISTSSRQSLVQLPPSAPSKE